MDDWFNSYAIVIYYFYRRLPSNTKHLARKAKNRQIAARVDGATSSQEALNAYFDCPSKRPPHRLPHIIKAIPVLKLSLLMQQFAKKEVTLEIKV